MKSNVSDYIELVCSVYRDATTKCVADVFDLRDLETIRSRVESREGLSFLTIALPRFCRDFERSLANGVIDSTLFSRWKRSKGGIMPAFLQGMISQLFNRETGRMWNDEDTPNGVCSNDFTTIIESVRQICLLFKKVELACSENRIQASLDSFISIEQSFDAFSLSKEDHEVFRLVSSMLWDGIGTDFDVFSLVPKHGPGATAERISGNQKYVWRSWHDRLEPFFPLVDTAYPLGIPVDSEELKFVTIVPEELEPPVRVVLVPKTLKSPRIIAIEPCCMQFVQQGIRDFLYRKLETYWLSSGHINFKDQTVNQRLAMESSKTGRLVTIDLSDASDRVPRDLALEMFSGCPELRDSINACRSTSALLPSGQILGPLKKFASMGSALCFPIEAMYFYTICVIALMEDNHFSYSRENILKVSRDLYIYGDDIIAPRVNATAILDCLQKYNCKVNTDKTFVSGSFRESCGVDAYDGYAVTPVYIRQPRPEDGQQAESIVSWVASANSFYLKGYWKTTQLMFNKLETVVGPLPYLPDTSPGLGRISFLGYRSTENPQKGTRWNGDLQRLEIKVLVTEPVRRTDVLEGYGALAKCFYGLLESEAKCDLVNKGLTPRWTSSAELPGGREGSELESSVLHGAVKLKRRWAPTS